MTYTLNGDVITYNKDTRRWSGSNMLALNVLDLQTLRTMDKIPPLAYKGASDKFIIEDIKLGMESQGFDFRYIDTAQVDQARIHMIETEDGTKKMFESAEGFLSYFYASQE